MTIQNICIGICDIHPDFLCCRGCFRTRLEIAKWSKATDEEKLIIIKSTELKKKIYGELNAR